MSEKLSPQLFKLEPRIRYVAVNQGGRIVEMEQNPERPTHNPHESDMMEELIVNPIVLEIARRRGNIDLNGMHYVVIRYGTLYQLLMPYKAGHVSIGIELEDDPVEMARRVARHLQLPMDEAEARRAA